LNQYPEKTIGITNIILDIFNANEMIAYLYKNLLFRFSLYL